MKAFVFPGQGAQFVGMGKDLYENSALAKELFEKANDILGYRITDIMFNGTDEDLRQTKVTQPAVFLHSVISALCMGEEFKPEMTAGHSLGEFSALVAAGALSFEDGLKLVYARAMAMQKACEAHPSTMAAIIALPDEKVEETAALFDKVYPVNYNSPGQVVVSAAEASIGEFEAKVKEEGGRTMRLNVSGGFHSPFMHEAAVSFAEELNKYTFAEPEMPIYSNVTGKKYEGDIKNLLSKQIESPVRWVSIVSEMINQGIDTFIEIGPGSTLTGLIKRINKDVRTYNVSDAESIGHIISEVSNG